MGNIKELHHATSEDIEIMVLMDEGMTRQEADEYIAYKNEESYQDEQLTYHDPDFWIEAEQFNDERGDV